VRESGREYLRLLAGAVLLNNLVLGVGLVWLLNQGQPQLLQGLATTQGVQFEGLTLQSLATYSLALLVVKLCGLIAHYLPLRHLRKTSISNGLRGAL
jgi:hypothetical protein